MTGTGLQVRTAQAADYQRIGDLTVAAYLHGEHMSPDNGYLQHLRQVADRSEQAQVLVAEVDGEVAASVTVTDYDGAYAEVARPSEMEFRMLAVAPEYQGRGIARHLVRHILAQAEARPEVTAVTLCSLRSMTGAHALYRSEGFREDPSRDFVLMTPTTCARFPFFARKIRKTAPETRLRPPRRDVNSR